MKRILVLLVIFFTAFSANSDINLNSTTNFSYTIRALHTDIWFASSPDSSEEISSPYTITNFDDNLRQFYLNFSSNEIGTHTLSLTVEPLKSEYNIIIPHIVTVLDDSFNDVAVFDYRNISPINDTTEDILVYVSGASTNEYHYAFLYNFVNNDGNAIDLPSFTAGTYESTITCTLNYGG